MRWIFGSLVLANLVYALVVWQQSGKQQEVPSVEVRAIEGEELLLLSELGTTNRLVRQQAALTDGVVDRSAGNELCTIVGPFGETLRAEYFVEYLSALDVVAEVKRVEVPGEPGYWVFQTPQPSRKAALRRLQELQAKGVDSYVIPKGELENAISFGMFSVEAGAQQRLTQIINLGYEASVKKIDRAVEEIWVSLVAREADKVGENQWLELLNREEGLEMRQNFCPAVASE